MHWKNRFFPALPFKLCRLWKIQKIKKENGSNKVLGFEGHFCIFLAATTRNIYSLKLVFFLPKSMAFICATIVGRMLFLLFKMPTEFSVKKKGNSRRSQINQHSAATSD
jgi:hypothetical protein